MGLAGVAEELVEVHRAGEGANGISIRSGVDIGDQVEVEVEHVFTGVVDGEEGADGHACRRGLDQMEGVAVGFLDGVLELVVLDLDAVDAAGSALTVTELLAQAAHGGGEADVDHLLVTQLLLQAASVVVGDEVAVAHGAEQLVVLVLAEDRDHVDQATGVAVDDVHRELGDSRP